MVGQRRLGFRSRSHCKIIYRTAKTIYPSKPPEISLPSVEISILHIQTSRIRPKSHLMNNLYTIGFTVHCTTTKRNPSKLDLLQSRSKFHGDRVPLLQEVRSSTPDFSNSSPVTAIIPQVIKSLIASK
jgi:hypothetical protein